MIFKSNSASIRMSIAYIKKNNKHQTRHSVNINCMTSEKVFLRTWMRDSDSGSWEP